MTIFGLSSVMPFNYSDKGTHSHCSSPLREGANQPPLSSISSRMASSPLMSAGQP